MRLVGGMRRGGAPGWIAPLALACGAIACSAGGCAQGGEQHELVVDLVTDYVPGVEFHRVRVELDRTSLDGGAGGGGLESVEHLAERDQDFIAGQRIAELVLGQPGRHLMQVTLLEDDGSVVVTRRVRLQIDGDRLVTVVITRSCGGLDCPGPDDPPEATTCLGGRCVAPDCDALGGEGCGAPECGADAECTTLVDCATGRCQDGACLYAGDDASCGSQEYCNVDRGCVPLPGTEPCTPESESCNEEDDDCDGTTDEGFDLSSDPANCGACGNVCDDSHATASCGGGSCALTCDEGWEDCNGDPSDGCEAFLTRAATCGDCDTRCTDPTPVCVPDGGGASCQDECPPESPTLCSGTCVDTDTSLMHCGGCDSPCEPANATGDCSGGSCGIASCDAGWDDCNGDPSDGCEADLSTPSTCGGCGTSCPGSMPYCVPNGGSFTCTDGCSDGVRGGDETDVDCGGSLCDPCSAGDSCGGDSDCDTGLECDGGTCVACGECLPGEDGSCTTSCGTTGTRTCGGDCSWGTCNPPSESCNVADEDCDGSCDEGLSGCLAGVHRSVGDGDHFYTKSLSEAGCCGYTLEFEDYFFVYASDHADVVPLYRCYNGAFPDHFLTTSSSCEGASGYELEHTLGWVATSPTCNSRPLYRLYNPDTGDHFYTTSASERDSAISSGYIDEGTEAHVW